MTPADLAHLYSTLRRRVCLRVPGACDEISVPLPSDFNGELSFIRLVSWSYVLVNEAARVPLPYLMELPPLRSVGVLKRDVGYLRTFIAHNLNFAEKRDAKTEMAVHTWFRGACGQGSPREEGHFSASCQSLAEQIRSALDGSLSACDLLDDAVDGDRLVEDLVQRIDVNWPAFAFDRFVLDAVTRIGNPGIDLAGFRSKRIDVWRKALASAAFEDRERALQTQIESDLLGVMASRLPITAQEAIDRLAILGPEGVAASLLILRASNSSGLSVPQLIERAEQLASAGIATESSV